MTRIKVTERCCPIRAYANNRPRCFGLIRRGRVLKPQKREKKEKPTGESAGPPSLWVFGRTELKVKDKSVKIPGFKEVHD